MGVEVWKSSSRVDVESEPERGVSLEAVKGHNGFDLDVIVLLDHQ